MPTRVFRHARIRTGVAGAPVAEAIAADNGRIVAVGSEAEVRRAVGSAAELIDLAGACILPGLYDAHIHTENLADSLTAVDLRTAHDLDDALTRIADFSTRLSADAWVTGGRWDANRWVGRGRPTRQSLDTLLGDRPAVLDSIDGHTAWVNSAALRIAGIDSNTADPAGGAYGLGRRRRAHRDRPGVRDRAVSRSCPAGLADRSVRASARRARGAARRRPDQHPRHRRRGGPRGLPDAAGPGPARSPGAQGDPCRCARGRDRRRP